MYSQERVWYFTVQLIVLADSDCRVYAWSHSTQTTNVFAVSAPHESRGVRNCKVPDPFLRKGVARETREAEGEEEIASWLSSLTEHAAPQACLILGH